MPPTERIITLKSGDAVARVALQGGELLGWRAGGRDLLWTPDPAIWPRSAPILFPIVGWARDGLIRVDGQSYPLGVHGFASYMPFECENVADDRATLVLLDGPHTRALFPFSFRLSVTFTLTPDSLDCSLVVSNSGDKILPYAIGLHPGFAWPMAGSAAPHRIIFAEREQPRVPVIAPGGLFSQSMRPVPLAGCELALDAALFAQEALCFLNARSTALIYDNGAGTQLRVEHTNMPHIALWARPPAPFLCIESWTGYGDPEGFAGDLRDKPSMLLLRPGQQGCHGARYTIVQHHNSGLI